MYSSSEKATSHVMTFDGKQIIPNTADIELLGCEDETTIKLQKTLQENESCIERISKIIDDIHTF